MKAIILIFSILVCVTSKPQFGFPQTLGYQTNTAANLGYQTNTAATLGYQTNTAATILRFDFVNNNGSYAFDVQTSDGFHHTAKGIPVSSPGALQTYSQIGQDGKIYTVQYIAGANGFQIRVVQQPKPIPPPVAAAPVGRDCEASLCGVPF